jgi:ribosome maturation factor RimP
VIEAAGYDLEELAVSRAGRRHLLRITVDADGGVSLDAVADLSRDISAALDRAEETGGDFGTGEYVLEVSSPGVDRPLTEPRHWRRNIGRLVEVAAGERRITGRVVAADAAEVILEVGGQRHGYGYADLGTGRVQVEFGRLDELDDDELDEFADEAEEEDGE